MRIWFDADKSLIFIEGVRAVYPPCSLTATLNADKISIFLVEGTTRIVGGLKYTDIMDHNSNTFSNIMDAFTYLVQVFSSTPIDNDIIFVDIFNASLQ